MTNDSHMIKMILIYDHHDNLSTLIDSSSFWTAPMKWQRPRSVPKSLAPQSNIWRIIILIVIRFSSFWPKSSSSSSSSSPAFPPNRCRAPFVHTCTGTSAETRTSPSKFSDHNMISCSKQLVLVLLGSLVSVTYYFRGTLCQICQKILAGVRPPSTFLTMPGFWRFLNVHTSLTCLVFILGTRNTILKKLRFVQSFHSFRSLSTGLSKW